jgi:nitrogenase iron protein NifH
MRERGGARLGGIIHNARGAKDDAGVVYEFADGVGGTVIGDIPRSDLILKAETEMKTVIEAYPESDIAACFMDLAGRILENKDGVIPRMLSDEEIEELGKKIVLSGIQA